MSANLTKQQLGFAKERIDGMKQSEAYRNNYNCANMSPQAIAVEASRLVKLPKVALMIDDATKAVVAELVVERKYTAEILAAEAEFNLAQARRLDQMAPANRAVELMARLSGNLEGPPAHTEVKITKVTVILPAPATGETVVDVSEYHVISDVEEEEQGP